MHTDPPEYRNSSSRNIDRTPDPAVLYDYTLRCAIYTCIEQNDIQQQSPSCIEQTDSIRRSSLQYLSRHRPSLRLINRHKPSLHRLSRYRHSVRLSAVSDMIGNIADKFTYDENDSKDKLTKPVVIGLLHRLDDITDGKDVSKTEYLDQRFISTARQVRAFVKQHRYRPQGSISDIAVMFRSTSKTELNRTNQDPVAWDEDLERFVGHFTEILLLVLEEDAPGSASSELIGALSDSIFSGKQETPKNIVIDTNSSDIFAIIENFPMVKAIQKMFQIETAIHRQKLHDLYSTCTELNCFRDLQRLRIASSSPAKRENFYSQNAYSAWLTRENKYLQGLMDVIAEQTMITSDLFSPISDVSIEKTYGFMATEQTPYANIPNDPEAYFYLLMKMCLEIDSKITCDTQNTNFSALSQESEDLLRECANTWRISSPFKAVSYLEIIKIRLDKSMGTLTDIDMKDARNAIWELYKCIKENDTSSWTISDYKNLIRVCDGLDETCLQSLSVTLTQYWRVSPAFLKAQLSLIESIYDNPAYPGDHSSFKEKLLLLEDEVAGAAVSRWRMLEKSLSDSQNDDMRNLINLADRMAKELADVSKKFKKPIQGELYIPAIVIARQIPFFILEMENWAFLSQTKNAPIDLIFKLYDKVLILKRLYGQYGPRQNLMVFKVESWFSLHVQRWLKVTDGETPEWVSNAIKQDEFKCINETVPHSSSVIDLFTMFYQAVDFVQKLEWPNNLQKCGFHVALSRIIGIAIEQYITEMEKYITSDIYPHAKVEKDSQSNTQLFSRARPSLPRSDSHTSTYEEPDVFLAGTCIKINNIEGVRIKLDRLYQSMNVDDIAEELKEYKSRLSPSRREKEEPSEYLYSIKVIRAQNIPPSDRNGKSDPYVVLEIDSEPVARTRAVYETLNPRWDQVFDLNLSNKPIDVLALVYDEDLIGADESCGCGWIKLDPLYYSDFQIHEHVVNLKPQGQLILRISMEGEKDDIQFWFGKAFRALKRAESDVAALIVDKMGGYFKQILNRKNLDKLMGKQHGFFSSFSRSSKQVEPTLQDCEDCIAPLLEYLENNLKVLHDNLSETNMQFIVMSVWKEILIILEDILLPPLSEELSEYKPLDDYELHVVYKWMELLKILFNGGEDGDAIPLSNLENSQYHALLAINTAYNLESERLIEDYNVALKNQFELALHGGEMADRSKSVYHSKNMAKKGNPVSTSIDIPNSDTILRILRMRQSKSVREFLRSEFIRRNNPMTFTALEKLYQSEDIPLVATIPTDDLEPMNKHPIPLR